MTTEHHPVHARISEPSTLRPLSLGAGVHPAQQNEAIEFDRIIRARNARANANRRPLLGEAFPEVAA